MLKIEILVKVVWLMLTMHQESSEVMKKLVQCAGAALWEI